MVDSVSTLGIQLINANNLQLGQGYMSTLTQQLSTGKVSLNLSDYTAGQAQNLLNLTSGIDQQKAFASVATTLAPRISLYDSSLTGLENVASLASSVVSSNPTYNPERNGAAATQLKGFMDQISYYLNQQINGRYLFSGSRYGTAPVGDISTLGTPTAADVNAIASNVSGNLLPAYDRSVGQTASASVENGSMVLQAKASGTDGNGITMALSAGTTPGTIKATISVPGQADEVYDNVAGTGATFWGNLSTAINAGSRLVTAQAGSVGVDPTAGKSYSLAGGTGSAKNNAATVSIGSNIKFDALSGGTGGNAITVNIANGTVSGKLVTISDGTTTETYDNIGGAGTAFWNNVANAVNGRPSALVSATTLGGSTAASNGTVGLTGGTSAADPAAYYQDQVAISTTQTLTYGISSNAAGFQQLVLGLRYAYAATQNTTNYTANMTQAATLITQGLASIRGIHSGLSSNNSTLTAAQDTQTATITALKNQLGDIQNVDINDVAVKIQAYQSQLQASYSATAIMTQLTILKYL